MLSYKYRAYPDRETGAKAVASIDGARFVYNFALEQLGNAPRGKRPTAYDIINMLPALKEEHEFLKALYSHMLQTTVKQLFSNISALAGAKRAGRRIGRPRFKNAQRYKSIRYNSQGYFVDMENCTVSLAKIGIMRYDGHREVPEHIDGVILKRVEDKWYVVFQCEVPDVEQKPIDENKVVGLDVGVKSFVQDSDGHEIQNPKFLAQKLSRLKFLQKSLSRKQKGSESRNDARRLVARLHEKIAKIRDNRNHQESRKYVNGYDCIVVEDLNIPDMVNRQHRIKKMGPAARRTLRRNIHDAAWGDFTRKIEYKAEGAGIRLIRVEAKNTTQTCSHCGEIVLKDISVRTHHCPYCGFEIDRDDNAAINILNRGLAIIRAGNRPQPAEKGTSTVQNDGKHPSTKQEATTL